MATSYASGGSLVTESLSPEGLDPVYGGPEDAGPQERGGGGVALLMAARAGVSASSP